MAQTDERPGGVKELGHMVLYVRNLERRSGFYRDVLGGGRSVPGAAGRCRRAFSSGRTHHELLLIEVGEDAEAFRRVAAWACTTSV